MQREINRSTDFSTSDVSCLFTTFFCSIKVDSWKKKTWNPYFIKDKISKHEDSLFSENTGKLKAGLSCHHSFNNDKRYYVTSSIEKDVDRLIEDLDKAFAK